MSFLTACSAPPERWEAADARFALWRRAAALAAANLKWERWWRRLLSKGPGRVSAALSDFGALSQDDWDELEEAAAGRGSAPLGASPLARFRRARRSTAGGSDAIDGSGSEAEA